MTGMPPPHNLEAEQSLICSFLLGNNPEEAVAILDSEDFYSSAHKHIWTAILSLYKNKEPVGPNEVYNELKSMGKLESDTGTYLSKLMDIPQAVGIEHTAKRIKACSQRRKLIQIANQLSKSAYDDTTDLHGFTDIAKTNIEQLVGSNGTGDKKLRNRNISSEVREWVLFASGQITTFDCNRDLGLVTPEQKKAANTAFLRLKDEGIIERHGERNGCYRLIEKGLDDEMVFLEEEVFEYPVKLPFGLNDLVSLYPQNIVVIAGSKSAGKTALLLNIAIANQDRHEIIYLNSEMGPVEWTQRMKKFGYRSRADIKFKAKTCHHNFHDRIDGGKKIFIIDYLEIHDNFFEIAKPIREIHEKLKDGICFIAIQKKGSEPLGRGAEFSQEKARLYLSMDYQETFDGCSKLTIVDAKAQKTPSNSKGLYKRIKILGGAKMECMDKEWLRG